ncbi:unnamed protein product [Adineta steineri]|uniref:Uncharacterized protein n=1 Tax=Adineta steineri TaxID=433720 RepID=A0A815NDQ6_9BILA|nr:unnamed protein product [Adineta steineri]CAF3573720.1 unnamed protein product [Adineta steineri]
MNNSTLFIIFGSLVVFSLAGIIFIILLTTNNSSIKTQSLDIGEDLQRINTKDPAAPRFSDKFIIDTSFP